MFGSRHNNPAYLFILVFLIICFGGRLVDQLHFGPRKAGDVYWIANPDGAEGFAEPGDELPVVHLRYGSNLTLTWAESYGAKILGSNIPYGQSDPVCYEHFEHFTTEEGQELWFRKTDLLRRGSWEYKDGATFFTTHPEGTSGFLQFGDWENNIHIPYHSKLTLIGATAHGSRKSTVVDQIQIGERSWYAVQQVCLQVRASDGKAVWVLERHLAFWE